LAIGPYLWRRWHNSDHHNNTQVEGVDPDHLFTIEDYKQNPVLRWLYRISPLLRNIIIFSSFGYRMTQQMIRMVITYLRSKKSTNGQRVLIVAQLVVPLVFWIGGSLALGTQVLFWGYFIPVLIGNAVVISYIATNHFLNPLADDRDVLATSLSVTLPRPLRWLDRGINGSALTSHTTCTSGARQIREVDRSQSRGVVPGPVHTMSDHHRGSSCFGKRRGIRKQNDARRSPSRVRAGTLGHGLNLKNESESLARKDKGLHH